MQECKVQREAAGAFLLKKQQRGPGAEVEWVGCGGRGGRPGPDHAWMALWAMGKTWDFFFFFLVGRFWRVMNRK